MKIKVLIAGLLALVFLIGCDSDEDDIITKLDSLEESELYESSSKIHHVENGGFFTVMMEKEFFDKIQDNPVDSALKTFESLEVTTTYDIIAVFEEQCKVWDAEIEHIILSLKDFLSEEDYQKLLDNQAYWELYIESSLELEIKMLYPQSEYTAMGSIYQPQPMNVKSEKTRARCIELLAYLYLFTEEVEFKYNQDIDIK